MARLLLPLLLVLGACAGTPTASRGAPPEVSARALSPVLTAARTSDDPSILHVHLAARLPEVGEEGRYVAELEDAQGRFLGRVPLELSRRNGVLRPVGPAGTWARVRLPDELDVHRVRIAAIR